MPSLRKRWRPESRKCQLRHAHDHHAQKHHKNHKMLNSESNLIQVVASLRAEKAILKKKLQESEAFNRRLQGELLDKIPMRKFICIELVVNNGSRKKIQPIASRFQRVCANSGTIEKEILVPQPLLVSYALKLTCTF